METQIKTTIFEDIIETLISNGDIDICHEYGEMGYTLDDDKKGILFGNWNDFDRYPNFMERLENEYEIEWHDEWIIDYDNSKAYRTSPDSYGWEQQFRITDCGELITPDDDVSEWIDECVVDYNTYTSKISALPSFIDEDEIIGEGFELIGEDYENGWYGKEDRPEEIAEDLIEDKGFNEVLFQIDFVSQFNLGFKVYAK